MNVFVSYCYIDSEVVKLLADQLHKKGISCWLEEQEVQLGDSLFEKISDAIKHADAILIILSKNTTKSRWQSSEIAMAVSAQQKSGKKIIPVLLNKDIEVPFFLKDRFYCTVLHEDDIPRVAMQIMLALSLHKKIPREALRIQNQLDILSAEKVMLKFECKAFEQKQRIGTQWLFACVGSSSAILTIVALIISLFSTFNVDLSFFTTAVIFLLGITSGVLFPFVAKMLLKYMRSKNMQGGG